MILKKTTEVKVPAGADRMTLKICVLNGSPKGDLSVTLQYIKYMERFANNAEFEIFEISSKIDKIEKSADHLNRIKEGIRKADAVIWSFPIYYMLVPSQLKRFIELLFEDKEFRPKEKYATAVTTSIHFYDHIAHNYIHAISEDLGFAYLEGYSASMMDLAERGGRLTARSFIEHFVESIENRHQVTRAYGESNWTPPDLNLKTKRNMLSTKWQICVIADDYSEESNIGKMIRSFESSCQASTYVLNMNEIDLRGGCLGCIRCGYDGSCFYHDGMKEVFESRVMPADAVVFAGEIRDRFLSAEMKKFMDRTFYNGHRPVLKGKRAAFILSGPLRDNHNLREMLSAYVEISGMYNLGFVTDECACSDDLEREIEALARGLSWSLEKEFVKPASFRGVGGWLLFRDFVFLHRSVFKADYDFYRSNGLFDFPQRRYLKRVANYAGCKLLSVPRFRREFLKAIKKQMVKPLQKAAKK